MAPYEALNGRRCSTPLCWQQDAESVVLGPEFLRQNTEKVKLIQDRMRATKSRQKSYADKIRGRWSLRRVTMYSSRLHEQ